MKSPQRKCMIQFMYMRQLRLSAEVHCEASYYNERLSVWEPLLEPLEDPKTGRLLAWLLAAEVRVHFVLDFKVLASRPRLDTTLRDHALCV